MAYSTPLIFSHYPHIILPISVSTRRYIVFQIAAFIFIWFFGLLFFPQCRLLPLLSLLQLLLLLSHVVFAVVLKNVLFMLHYVASSCCQFFFTFRLTFVTFIAACVSDCVYVLQWVFVCVWVCVQDCLNIFTFALQLPRLRFGLCRFFRLLLWYILFAYPCRRCIYFAQKYAAQLGKHLQSYKVQKHNINSKSALTVELIQLFIFIYAKSQRWVYTIANIGTINCIYTAYKSCYCCIH